MVSFWEWEGWRLWVLEGAWGVLGREVCPPWAAGWPRMVILVVGWEGVGAFGDFRVVVEEAGEGAVTLEVTDVTDWRSTREQGWRG